MAPTKTDKTEKDAKLTPEQSAAMILDYLRKTNRPYSATEISSNLKNRVTKTAAAKLLKDMHERGEIEGKAAGKQSVYHAIQDEADEADTAKLQEMDAEASRLRDETTALKAKEKELRTALRESATQVPLPELKAMVTDLGQRKAELAARLAKLQRGNLKPVSVEEREQVNREHRKWARCAGNRKKIRVEMWGVIEGTIEKGQAAELKEELDLNF